MHTDTRSYIHTYLLDIHLHVCFNLIAVVLSAFNVLYINSVDLESLTGPEAVSRSIDRTFGSAPGPPDAVEVNLKVSSLGITLTDNRRRYCFIR